MRLRWFLRMGVIALGLAYLGLTRDGAWRLSLWAAASFGVVALAYGLDRADVFGKRRDGSLPPLRTLALLPVHAMTRLTFALWRATTSENANDELEDGVHIGRRPRAAELPDGTRGVLDLTAEFGVSPDVARGREVTCAPILDGMPAESTRLREAALALEALPRPALLHCAQGHGRTGMVAAAWLLVTGRAATPDEALARVRGARAGAVPNRAQVEALNGLAEN